MAAVGERGYTGDAARVEAMVARHGPALLRVANQFSLCHDDALDAYQRALEIYLRRLATVDPATEGAWLRVVVKHEAMAIRAHRQDSVDREHVDLDDSINPGLREIDDAVAGGERVERSVEALRALKPDEARALLLKAEGLSYDEIGRRFGWSYTKVNRSITEGRAHFLKVFRGIESGDACERHQDVLEALAEGTATSAQVISIRAHMRHCASCRATLRSTRRRRRFALLAPLAWLRALLARADVGTATQYAASSGGGRISAAAALLSLCLGGAGAVCVATGALPPPPLVAHAKPAATPAPRRPRARPRPTPAPRPPVSSATPTPAHVAAATATPARTATSRPRRTARTAAAPSKPKRAREFAFESKPGGTGVIAKRGGVVASAASAGTPHQTTSAPPASKGPSTHEFGFEGG